MAVKQTTLVSCRTVNKKRPCEQGEVANNFARRIVKAGVDNPVGRRPTYAGVLYVAKKVYSRVCFANPVEYKSFAFPRASRSGKGEHSGAGNARILKSTFIISSGGSIKRERNNSKRDIPTQRPLLSMDSKLACLVRSIGK